MRTLRAGILPVAMLAAALALGACGHEEELEVREGEAVKVGSLEYNVRLTRFLNPDDREDAAYLTERPKLPAGREYLGVFVRIENEGDEPAAPPARITVRDTRDNVYEPIRTSNIFALQTGRPIQPEHVVPAPSSPAASGPVNGAMLLYLVDAAVSENRPLELEIPSGEGESGKIELDI